METKTAIGLAFAGAAAVATLSIWVMSRPAAPKSKPRSCWLTKAQLLAVLKATVADSRAVMKEIFATVDNLTQRGVSQGEVQAYANQTFAKKLGESDQRIRSKFGTTKRQIKKGVALYGDDPEIKTQVAELDQMLDMLMPRRSAVPKGMTEDKFVDFFCTLMDAQTDRIEEVANDLKEKMKKKGVSGADAYLDELSRQLSKEMASMKETYLRDFGISDSEFTSCIEAYQTNDRLKSTVVRNRQISQKAQIYP